ncbi:MAG: hypothetical protein K2J40_10995 [Ruminococcus sp.]|nr:hypothetical protein [Ruminococcus sp.]
MNGKFTYISNILTVTAVILVIYGIHADSPEILFISIYVAVLSFLWKPHGKFEADEKQVVFRTVGRKNIINYSDIENISIEKNWKRTRLEDYYEIELTIKTKNKTYTFTDHLKPDMHEIADNPDRLSEIMKDNDLIKLCKYIENLRKKC